MTKRNNEKQIRLCVENWDHEAPLRLNKGHAVGSRKIVTRGIVTSDDLGAFHGPYSRLLLCQIQDVLSKGYEYRLLDEDGNEALRLYPCVEKDMKTVFVAAQTMGYFRRSLGDKRVVPFVKGQHATNREAQATVVASRTSNKTRRHDHKAVTPDTMVTCPECGAEFRVGKQLV